MMSFWIKLSSFYHNRGGDKISGGNGGNGIMKELERLVETCNDSNIKILAMALYNTRMEMFSIKEDIQDIKCYIQIGLTVIALLLSIIAIISYVK